MIARRAAAPGRLRWHWPLLACVCACAGLFLAAGSARALPTFQWLALERGLRAHAPVAALAFDPQDSNRLYVGLANGQGLWISDDGGMTGQAAPALAGRAVYALLADPARPGLLLAGTDAGLYRSADRGRTWQADPGVPPRAVYALARAAQGGVLAGSVWPAVVYRQAAAGEPWQALAPLPGGNATLALAASLQGRTVLAGSDGAGLFRSQDGGQSWQAVPEIGQTFVAGLAYSADGRLAWARTRRGLFLSRDGGSTWAVTAGEVAGRIDALAPDPAGQTVYAGTGDGMLYRGPANGSGGWQPWGAGLDRPGLFSVLQIAPHPVARWYAGTEFGLYASDDAGLSWRPASRGPGYAAARAMAAAAGGSLYLADADGVYRWDAVTETWQPRRSGLPPGSALAVAASPAQPGLLFASLDGDLYRSEDGGGRWSLTGWSRRGVQALLLDPHDARHLYVRMAYERVYESTDGGASWAARWNGLGLSTQVISLALDPARPATLYAGTDIGFFRSLDGAATWQSAGPQLAGQTVFCVAVDRQDGQVLYAGATNGIYRSRDGGQSWERWGRGLEDVTVTALAFDPDDRRLIYAGTKYQGVYGSADGGATWQSAGPEPTSVNALAFSPGLGLLAATEHGVFRLGGGAP